MFAQRTSTRASNVEEKVTPASVVSLPKEQDVLNVKDVMALVDAELDAYIAMSKTKENTEAIAVLAIEANEYLAQQRTNARDIWKPLESLISKELTNWTQETRQSYQNIESNLQTELQQFQRQPHIDPTLSQELNVELNEYHKELRESTKHLQENKEIQSDLQKEIDLYNQIANKTWYDRMTLKNIPYVGKISGFVTSVAGSTAGHGLRFGMKWALGVGTGPVGLMTQMAITGGVSLTLNVVRNAPALFTGTQKWKTAKEVGLNVIGTMAGELTGTFVGSLFPESAKSFVGSYVTGFFTGLATLHPKTANQGQQIEANNFLQTVLREQELKLQQLPEAERKEAKEKMDRALLVELNKNKQGILQATTAKIMAATIATATVAGAVATGTAAPILDGLLWAYKNDLPIVTPLVEKGIGSAVIKGIETATGKNVYEINHRVAQLVSERTNELSQAVLGQDLSKAHVTPEFMRKFIREQVGSTLFEELTFQQLVQHATETGLNVGVQQSLGALIAQTKQWNSIEEAEKDIVKFAGAAQKAMNDVLSTTKDQLMNVSDAVQSVYTQAMYSLSDSAQANADAEALTEAATNMAGASGVAGVIAVAPKTVEQLKQEAAVAREQAKKLNERDRRFAQLGQTSKNEAQEIEDKFKAINGKLVNSLQDTKLGDREQRRAEARQKSQEIRDQVAKEAYEVGQQFKNMAKNFDKQTTDLLQKFEQESGIKLDTRQQLQVHQAIQTKFRHDHPEISKAFSKDGILHNVQFEGAAYVVGGLAVGGALSGTAKTVAQVANAYDIGKKALGIGALAAKAGSIYSGSETLGTTADSLAAAHSVLPTLPNLSKPAGSIGETIQQINDMRYANLNEWTAIRGLGYLGRQEQAAVASEVLFGTGLTNFVRGSWFG
jgi:hypothetical protein